MQVGNPDILVDSLIDSIWLCLLNLSLWLFLFDLQETSAQKAEAWAAVERMLQSRLQVSNLSINSVCHGFEAWTSALRALVVAQEAEAKAAAAEERQRSINERLSQTLSRVNVLEAQVNCLMLPLMFLIVERAIELNWKHFGYMGR